MPTVSNDLPRARVNGPMTIISEIGTRQSRNTNQLLVIPTYSYNVVKLAGGWTTTNREKQAKLEILFNTSDDIGNPRYVVGGHTMLLSGHDPTTYRQSCQFEVVVEHIVYRSIGIRLVTTDPGTPTQAIVSCLLTTDLVGMPLSYSIDSTRSLSRYLPYIGAGAIMMLAGAGTGTRNR